MMSDVKREMEIMSCLVPLSHQSLNGAENCSVQLRAANLPLLCLLGKARIIEIFKVMTT